MPVGSQPDLRVGPRPSPVPPTASCGAGGGRTVVAARAVGVRGAREAGGGAAHGLEWGCGGPEGDGQPGWCRVHRLLFIVIGGLRGGSGGTHGLMWALGPDVGVFPEGGGVPVGSYPHLRVGPMPSPVPPTASCGAGGGRTTTARAVGIRGAREAGGAAALGLVWARPAVVAVSPEGGGVPVGSSSDLRVGPRPSSAPAAASSGAGGGRRVTARALSF